MHNKNTLSATWSYNSNRIVQEMRRSISLPDKNIHIAIVAFSVFPQKRKLKQVQYITKTNFSFC
jgi:hypothetical protein